MSWATRGPQSAGRAVRAGVRFDADEDVVGEEVADARGITPRSIERSPIISSTLASGKSTRGSIF